MIRSIYLKLKSHKYSNCAFISLNKELHWKKTVFKMIVTKISMLDLVWIH